EMIAQRTEQEFFDTLVELNYVGKEMSLDSIRYKASELAKQIPRYSEWPHNAEQFWNAEALCWKGRIEKEVRDAIKNELSFLKGKNLDLGAGSVTYVENSVVADFSDEMLLLNDAMQKVAVNLEKKLPFSEESFDSTTMVFVANYIGNFEQLLRETKRVLRLGGKLVIVQSLQPVVELHRMHYKNIYGEAELRILLKNIGFDVKSYVKDVSGREILLVIGRK
ncbi:class I SAM-dependent methyltransferase, partial [Candidatus Woesearchaeota archaeon]|nr:class I SAM-dependent methyltransferase [Candidatus Woesearchaeota archaeon]